MAYSEAVLGGEGDVLCLVLQLGSPQEEDRKGRRMKGGDGGGVQKIPPEQLIFVCGLWAHETEMPLLGAGAGLGAAPS